MNPEQLLNEFISRNQNIDREKASRIINEQFLSLFPPHILEYCANYEIIQEKLLSLTNTQLNIISKIIASAEAAGQDWTIPAAEYITLVENPAYRELTGSLEGKLLTEKEISSLMFLTRNSFNYYGIRDYEGLTNIEDIRQTQYEKTKTSISPEIILLNKYGISFNTANNYIKRYGKDIKLLPRCAEREILEDIDHILKNEGTFEPISYDYDLINNLNSRLSNLFTYLYSRELYQLKEENIIQNYVTNDGTEIPVYNAGVEFTMSIHSIGMAAGDKPPADYYDSWNRNIARDGNFCNSIITGSSMQTSVRTCVFGFASYQPNDLKLIAPNDLGTGALVDDPIVSKIGHDKELIAKVEYRVPSQMINNTRFTNNEIYRSRRRVVNGKLEKVNPDYLVYLKQSSDTDVLNDPIWLETVKASTDYKKATGKALPIVIVDCEKCLAHKVQKLDEMINKFITNFDDEELLINIIELMHTLSMGHGRNKANIIDKYLSKEKKLKQLETILSVIAEMSEYVPRIALQHLTTLEETLNSENAKLNASPFWVKRFCGKDEIEKNITVFNVIEQYRKAIEKKLNGDSFGTSSNQNKM